MGLCPAAAGAAEVILSFEELMKYLAWLLKAAIFFTLFAFALNNQQDVTVHFFFGTQWRAPLAVSNIRALEISRFGVLSRSQPMVTLTTLDGSARRIHTLNLTPDTAEIGRRIADAVGLPAPESATVTGP